MSAATWRMPPTAQSRLHLRPGEPFPFFVAVCAEGEPPAPETMAVPGGLFVMLTHDDGLAWPDRRGELLMSAILDEGGAVLLGFESLADAVACDARVKRKAGR